MFGKRLRELREERDMTQRQLADVINLSPSTIGMYESGRRDPDSATLRRIAEYFGVSTDYLLGRTDERRPARPRGGYDLNEVAKNLPPDLVEKINRIPPESRQLFFRAVRELSVDAWRSVIDYMLWRLEQDKKAKCAKERDKDQE